MRLVSSVSHRRYEAYLVKEEHKVTNVDDMMQLG